ncbi:hypothetical protein NMG60_11027452 [Bertholletia excelsa]
MEVGKRNIRSTTSWLLLLVVMAAMVAAPAEAVTPDQCKQERDTGLAVCKEVFYGGSPSAACCQLIRAGHVECACPAIDAKLATIITVQEVTKLFATCGRNIVHNFQCGSLYFP